MPTFFDALLPYLLIGLGIVFVVGLIYALICSAFWVYDDAEARGQKGWLMVLLVLVCKWPLSLLFWLALRPPLPGEGATTQRVNAG